MWEKKFEVTRDGCFVVAEYAKEKKYVLNFETTGEAEIFVEQFKAAQNEIEENEMLKMKISIAVNTTHRTMKITFADAVGTLKMSCKMDENGDLCTFYHRLHAEITRYSC